MEDIDVEDNDPRDSLDVLSAHDFGWDLDVLRTSLIERIPKWIEEETGESQLPFPPQIVEGITEEDIEFLASKCKLEGITRYSYWSDVFHAVNVVFLTKEGESQRILSGLNSIPSAVPCIPVFLLSANAFWIEYTKAADLRGLRELKRPGRDDESEQAKFAEIFRTYAKEFLPLPRTFRLNDKADAICVMIEGIAEWITINHQNREALKTARRLLFWWGIEVSEEVIRERRKRRRKKLK